MKDKMKTSAEIRSEFLKFFEEKEHQIVPSAPVFPPDDPTLLFTNAGMNQFKDVFLGTGKRSYSKATDTQKCIRVSGKHNDLEAVGRDTYHHTFFEMLGNWSFGDYFKREAIRWAWELLTEIWKIPKENLYATYFEGNAEDKLPMDEETKKIWQEETDIDHSHILPFGKEDNFWEMGDTGPCGPCTEIHVDLGEGASTDPSLDSVNAGGSRFIEIWNLVFIQFNRRSDNSLENLPQQHVDTGMGFERLVALLQGKYSNYDTDLFTPIIEKIESLSGIKYERGHSSQDVAFRVICDHIRTLTIGFCDGILPSNTHRGYVLRRILRRAARFGRQNLGMQEPFMYKLIPTIIEIFSSIFPEMQKRQDHITLLVRTEEETFGKTLQRGLEVFTRLVEEFKEQNISIIPGEKAYDLYHRDGFPKDLVELMAEEESLSIDQEGWDKAEKEHKEKSKGKQFVMEDFQEDLEGLPASQFLGYEVTQSSSKIVKLIGVDKLILDQTPFYAESGGQIGDTGTIAGENFSFHVHDTQKFGDLFVHFGELKEGDIASLPSIVEAKIDEKRRHKIMANHTATHLLHWGLKKTLGNHATQQGSIVAEEKLRFDFSHPKKVSDKELKKIEQMVNELIYENITIESTTDSLEEARKKGAMALFGEKYGEIVRVVQVPPHSMELCGGTHVSATGNIGLFKIVSESAVQTGVRRIEAITRDVSVKRMQSVEKVLQDVKELLKAQNEEQIFARISALQEENKILKKKNKEDNQKDNKGKRDQLLEEATQVGDIKLITSKVENLDIPQLRELADLLRKSSAKCAGIIGTEKDNKVPLVAFVSDKLLSHDQLHAGEFLQKACSILGGGGNAKRKDFAQGQGKKIDNWKIVTQEVKQMVQKKLENN